MSRLGDILLPKGERWREGGLAQKHSTKTWKKQLTKSFNFSDLVLSVWGTKVKASSQQRLILLSVSLNTGLILVPRSLLDLPDMFSCIWIFQTLVTGWEVKFLSLPLWVEFTEIITHFCIGRLVICSSLTHYRNLNGGYSFQGRSRKIIILIGSPSASTSISKVQSFNFNNVVIT